MKKTIVIFSNPFGYGPTGVAVPVVEYFLHSLKIDEVIFAGSSLCLEILKGSKVNTVEVDERNEVEIERFLKKIDNAHVIGSQNRFSIKVAKKLSIPSAFIDVLAWFWKTLPAEHLMADEIFWLKFPDIENKIPNNQTNIHIVSSVITTGPEVKKQNLLVVHVGGAKYPLIKSIPYAYLSLLSKGLNALAELRMYNKILVVGGSEAAAYLRSKISNPSITVTSLSNGDFIRELEKSSHILTTAGVSSTLESFSAKTPTSFLLPINLSHLALTDLLKRQRACPQMLQWNSYISVDENIRDLNEKDALTLIDSYAQRVDGEVELSKCYIKDFIEMAKSIPDNVGQSKLIEYMGNSGGEEIAKTLINKWKLE